MSDSSLLIARLKNGAWNKKWPEGLLIEAANRIERLDFWAHKSSAAVNDMHTAIDKLESEVERLRKGINRHRIEFEEISTDAPGQYDLRLWALLEIGDE